MNGLDKSQEKKLLFIGGAISGISVGLYPFVLVNFIKGNYFDLFFFGTYTFLMAIILGYVIYKVINFKKRG